MAFGGDVVSGQIGGLTNCLLLNLDNGFDELVRVMMDYVEAINDTCASTFNSDQLTFGSVCTCASLPSYTDYFTVNTTTNETVPVTIFGYQYNTSYSKSIFYSDFPTASPYVVSVGATVLDPFAAQNSCGEFEGELYAEPLTGSGISGGGGFSTVSARPSWQDSMVSSYLSNYETPPTDYFNSSNRGYPDISLNGHNYMVVVQRQVGFYDGTSASSPSLAAMFSLMNEVLLSHGKKPLGLITPLLYKMAVDQPSAFHKIVPVTYYNRTIGADNSCTRSWCCQYGYKTSSSGWDPVTGLGTPNMGVIEDYIRTMNGLPTVAQEAASLTPAPTSAPTNAETRAPTSAAVPPTNNPTAAPTVSAAAGSAATAYVTPKTVTTAGAVVIGVLCAFFGAVFAFFAVKCRGAGNSESTYRRHNDAETKGALL
jgi:subtilase family serine protease